MKTKFIHGLIIIGVFLFVNTNIFAQNAPVFRSVEQPKTIRNIQT